MATEEYVRQATLASGIPDFSKDSMRVIQNPTGLSRDLFSTVGPNAQPSSAAAMKHLPQTSDQNDMRQITALWAADYRPVALHPLVTVVGRMCEMAIPCTSTDIMGVIDIDDDTPIIPVTRALEGIPIVRVANMEEMYTVLPKPLEKISLIDDDTEEEFDGAKIDGEGSTEYMKAEYIYLMNGYVLGQRDFGTERYPTRDRTLDDTFTTVFTRVKNQSLIANFGKGIHFAGSPAYHHQIVYCPYRKRNVILRFFAGVFEHNFTCTWDITEGIDEPLNQSTAKIQYSLGTEDEGKILEIMAATNDLTYGDMKRMA